MLIMQKEGCERGKKLALIIVASVLSVLFLFIFISFNGSITGFTAYVGESVEDLTQDKIDESVIQGLTENAEIRARVEFRKESDASIVDLFAEEDKQELIKKVSGKIKHQSEDHITLQINQQDLAVIEQTDQVEKVVAVNQRGFFLSDSINIINVSDVWDIEIIGETLDGFGETVCILDSGVDYNHVDLGGCFGDGCKIVGGYDYCADDTDCTTQDADPMDVHSHGTHVAGIIAANGTINGIAPMANIVILKVCNSAGVCWDDDIRAGIDWCINNSEQYNISVISMSLGAEMFTENCDNDFSDTEDITSAVNNATAKGISVVASSGNQGSTTEIAFPACLSNVIPAGATSKSDDIVYNRNPLVKLLAPGISITSTKLGGGSQVFSGTSVSAPHISTAIAILNQYKRIEGEELTALEYEDALYGAGKTIVDSGNNYSRIDVYSTLLSIDTQAPIGNLVSPNNSEQNLTNLEFRCNASDNLQLTNLTLMIWNQSDLYYEFSNSSVLDARLEIYQNLSLYEGNYVWNCLAEDNNGNSAFVSGSNYTLGSEICVEDWTCSNWTNCLDGNQTRECVDGNNCGTTIEIPDIIQDCSVVNETEQNQTTDETGDQEDDTEEETEDTNEDDSEETTETSESTTESSSTTTSSTTSSGGGGSGSSSLTTSDIEESSVEETPELPAQTESIDLNSRTIQKRGLQGLAIWTETGEFISNNWKILVLSVLGLVILIFVFLRLRKVKKIKVKHH